MAHAVGEQATGHVAETLHTVGTLNTAATAVLGGNAIVGYARAAFAKQEI